MILDAFLQLASNQTHSAASTVAMEDHIDLQSARDFGIGEPLALVINVKTALAGTAPTASFTVQVDDNGAFSSATTIATSATFSGAAAMPAGTQVVVPIPPLTQILTAVPGNAEFRFLRGQITLGGTGPSITIDAQIMPMNMVQLARTYPSGFVVQ